MSIRRWADVTQASLAETGGPFSRRYRRRSVIYMLVTAVGFTAVAEVWGVRAIGYLMVGNVVLVLGWLGVSYWRFARR